MVKPQPDAVPLSWRIKERSGFTTVEFSGDVEETADFSELRRRLTGVVLFNLSGVRRLNSTGVRAWIDFVRDLPNVNDLTFTHCSPAIVTQLNMIYNFRGPAKVRSLYAPFVCEKCFHEEEKLLDLQSHLPDGYQGSLPDFFCDECGEVLEFDDLPERYFAFMAETDR